MTIFKITLKPLALMALIALFSGTTLAQTETVEKMPQSQEQSYSDDQVKTFIQISKRMEQMQMQMMKKVETMAMEKGIDMETFKEMNAAQQESGELTGYTEAQRKAFMEIMQAVQSEQQAMMSKAQEIVKEQGMDFMTFQQMAMQSQSDEKLRGRIEAEVAEQE